MLTFAAKSSQSEATPSASAPHLVRRSLDTRAAGDEKRRDAADAGPAPAVVGRALHSPGRPLPAGERAFMERRFGHDFSAVRIHDDATAADAARAVSANAFTVGRDIAFAEEQYRPGSDAGRRLLAHELAHVVQNEPRVGASALRPPASALTVSAADDPREREADLFAERAMSPDATGRPVPAAHAHVQRPSAPGLVSRAKTDARPCLLKGTEPAAEPLSDPAVIAAVNTAWEMSFNHPPYDPLALDNLEGLPEAGAPPAPEAQAPQPQAPSSQTPPEGVHPRGRGGEQGATFRETYFVIKADGKPSDIKVSRYPLDIKGVALPAGALGFVHTHPTQKRAYPREERGGYEIVGDLATDEKAARASDVPVYAVGEKTVLKTCPNGRSETFRRGKLAAR